jgi:hypothetical protein
MLRPSFPCHLLDQAQQRPACQRLRAQRVELHQADPYTSRAIPGYKLRPAASPRLGTRPAAVRWSMAGPITQALRLATRRAPGGPSEVESGADAGSATEQAPRLIYRRLNSATRQSAALAPGRTPCAPVVLEASAKRLLPPAAMLRMSNPSATSLVAQSRRTAQKSQTKSQRDQTPGDAHRQSATISQVDASSGDAERRRNT